MLKCYCAHSAFETAIGEALGFYGLEPTSADVSQKSRAARTFGEQLRRIDLGGQVLARVRQQAPVGPDDRLLIERLVDSACQRLEDVDRPLIDPSCQGASVAAVVAYAAAGGGAVGSFGSFALSFVSDADLLEPPASPAVARQDVKPAPLTTNPNRRPPLPGSSSPAKTDPTRTIRSSRWSGAGKGVRK